MIQANGLIEIHKLKTKNKASKTTLFTRVIVIAQAYDKHM